MYVKRKRDSKKAINVGLSSMEKHILNLQKKTKIIEIDRFSEFFGLEKYVYLEEIINVFKNQYVRTPFETERFFCSEIIFFLTNHKKIRKLRIKQGVLLFFLKILLQVRQAFCHRSKQLATMFGRDVVDLKKNIVEFQQFNKLVAEFKIMIVLFKIIPSRLTKIIMFDLVMKRLTLKPLERLILKIRNLVS